VDILLVLIELFARCYERK